MGDFDDDELEATRRFYNESLIIHAFNDNHSLKISNFGKITLDDVKLEVPQEFVHEIRTGLHDNLDFLVVHCKNKLIVGNYKIYFTNGKIKKLNFFERLFRRQWIQLKMRNF